MKYAKLAAAFLYSVALFTACKTKDVVPPGKVTISNEKVTLNPSGFSPLTATISLETSVATKISLRVVGKHEAETDVVKDFDDIASTHNIPVLGLYADYDNTVELIFKDASGATLGNKSYTIKTAPLPADTYPAITIDAKNTALMAPGMTLVSYFGYKDNPFPQKPFMFDDYGDVRWYFDFRTSATLSNMFYDDGMERLQNGNLYFGDGSTNTIYELDFLGNTIDRWPLNGFLFHHNVQEKPNGNFLVTVSKPGSTIEDYIIEIDRSSKQIIRTWDLTQSLQYSRQTLTTDPVDWIHVNAIIYDASDNTIIISGRTQALVKLDENNNVVWIMGCHKGWGIAGNGADLNNFLLQPLDKNDQPITDQNVLDGNTNHTDFEWNWYQHAPLLMPNGHVMLFDNGGDNRNFSGAGQYSRAVEYDINTANKTVKQIWEYGKERGAATFSHIVSDVDFLSAENHVIFSPGAVNNATNYAKVVELDYATQNVLFEATITPQTSFYGITLHRTERLNLYP